MIMFDRRLLYSFGWSLFFMTIAFAALALLNLYSASYQTGLVYFKKQAIWLSIGVVVMVLVSFINNKLIKRYSLHIYGASIFLLIFVLIFGKEVAGSKSWIMLGPFASIQPSELAKIPVVLALARFYDRDYEGFPYGLLDLVKPVLLVALPLVLVMLQPDLGTGLLIILISGSMILFMGVKKITLAIILAVVVGFSYPAWHYFMKPYQKSRIMTFLDPARDPLNSGYNAIQSQIAVGSGKFTGKGFMAGSQSQLRFIPAQQTDFAFSVLAEEWGFVGGFFALLLYFMIILWILDTASRSKDTYSILVCYGIAAMFFWHAVVNVGMVIGLLPITGVPLLILSYGGSSTLTAMIGIGIVLGIRMRKFPIPEAAVELR
ncbi:MAG TPA: rod shape-determining protein RodA [Thermodesulfobacteriota bacterium]|nr:rod shape-determining protein RodA [Thermodesulfobacteriota bacterium]